MEYGMKVYWSLRYLYYSLILQLHHFHPPFLQLLRNSDLPLILGLYPTIPPLTGFRKRKRSRFVSDYSSAHGDYPDINPVDSAHVEAVVLLQRENS